MALLLVFACSSESASGENPNPNETSDTDDGDSVGTVSFCNVNNTLKPELVEYGESGLSVKIDLPSNVTFGSGVVEHGYQLKRIYDLKETSYDFLETVSEDFGFTIENLIHGFEYELIGYAKIGGEVCYTKPLTFVADRNYPMSPWSLTVPYGG
ncbi:MAG: hypothetical protein AB3N18_17245, partial [Allomuricauda sp.]